MSDENISKPEKLYTSREAASMLGVTSRTIQLWSESGILQAQKTPGGHRRFRASMLEKVASEFAAGGQVAQSPEALQTLRVLIAEDEPDLQKLYEMTMSGWELPIELNIVKDGYEALIQFGKYQPHVIILDLNMPRMDGFHMLSVIHDSIDHDATEVLVVSALSKGDIAERGGLPDGVKSFSKPIPFEKIEEIVQARINTMHA